MALELQLGAKDLAEYGGPEWLPFDPEALADMDYDALEEIERPMRLADGMTLARMLTYEWIAKTLPGIRAVFWVARQVAGIDKPEWDDFKPNPLACDWRTVGGGDVPPPGGSSEPPSETTQSKTA